VKRFAPLLLAAVLPATAQDEVPFIVTPDNVTLAMLQIAKVTPQDYVIDLGSGDGRIVITAARAASRLFSTSSRTYSMPRPVAPKRRAAVMTMRPSPEPRSIT
jgi:hypothetical protein